MNQRAKNAISAAIARLCEGQGWRTNAELIHELQAVLNAPQEGPKVTPEMRAEQLVRRMVSALVADNKAQALAVTREMCDLVFDLNAGTPQHDPVDPAHPHGYKPYVQHPPR